MKKTRANQKIESSPDDQSRLFEGRTADSDMSSSHISAASKAEDRRSSQPGTHLYRILPVDTLEGIALKFNVSVSTLKSLNGLRTNTDMYREKTLRVPSSLEDKPLHVAKGTLDGFDLALSRSKRDASDSFDEREWSREAVASPGEQQELISPGDSSREAGFDPEQSKRFASSRTTQVAPEQSILRNEIYALHPTPPMPRSGYDNGRWILTPDANMYGDANRTPVRQRKQMQQVPNRDANQEKPSRLKQERKTNETANGNSELTAAKGAKKDDRSYALTRSLEVHSSVVIDRGIDREDPTHVDNETNGGLRRHRDYVSVTISPMQKTNADTSWVMEHDAAWSGVVLPSSHLEARRKLKFLVRRGIPDRLRKSVWLLITGATDFLAENPTFYHDCLHRTFGDKIPDKFFQVPTFGGELRPGDHFLTEKGLIAARRILCTLASNHAEIEYLPVLPDLICLLLTFMSEGDTYVTVRCMLFASRNPNEHISYFVATKKEVHVFLYTFEDILQKKERKLREKMTSLRITSHDVADEWFLRFFLDSFPFQACLRFFDAFLGEGHKIMYRVAIALMKTCKADLLVAQTREEFVRVLRKRAAKTINPTYLLKRAFELQLQRKEFHRYNERNRAKVLHVVEPNIPVYYRPIIRTPSKIISDLQFELLYTFLPSRFGIEDPVQRYSSARDGYSFRYFIEKMSQVEPRQRSPTILLIRTMRGEVFGAFLGCNANWELSNGRGWIGERDCFLWTFVPEPAKYGWYDGCDTMFLHVDKLRGISIGGGNGTGLFIDADLTKGITQKCETFQNMPLTGDRREPFELAAFEIYGFE